MFATATEIKNSFGQYLKHVTDEKGEVIITKNNARVARLVPYVSDIEMYATVKENAGQYDYNRKTISFEEFMDISKDTQTRMEFIDGEIIVMESPSIFHQSILGNLYVLFKTFFKGKPCKPFLAPFDVILRLQERKTPDVFQPDLLVACDLENNVSERDRYMGTPTLTIEILSKATRSRDMVRKLNTYLESGVSEYWVVDPDLFRVTRYVFSNREYAGMEYFKKGDIVPSMVFNGLDIEVDAIFED